MANYTYMCPIPKAHDDAPGVGTWTDYPEDWAEQALDEHILQFHPTVTPQERVELVKLARGRAEWIDDLLSAEENFEPNTVSGNLLRYHKWLQDNTDLFDPVMVRLVLDYGDPLTFDDEELKEHVRLFLQQADGSGDVDENVHNRLRRKRSADEILSDVSELIYTGLDSKTAPENILAKIRDTLRG